MRRRIRPLDDFENDQGVDDVGGILSCVEALVLKVKVEAQTRRKRSRVRADEGNFHKSDQMAQRRKQDARTIDDLPRRIFLRKG